MKLNSEFDQYAENYEKNIGPLIRLTGENREYFARERVAWLLRLLSQVRLSPRSVVDFGCGTGIAARWLIDSLNLDSYIGLDVSVQSLEIAKRECKSGREAFMTIEEYKPDGTIELVFTNGVFHHIPLDKREGAMNYIYRSLKQDGIVAFYEYNPLNPLLLLGMKLSPVDRNAIPFTLAAGKQLLQRGGFEILLSKYVFFFPKMLGWFRRFERSMTQIPFGAQYIIIARKLP